MPILSHTSFLGPQEVDVFRARAGAAGNTEAQTFGVQRYTTGDGGPPLYLLGNQFIAPGTVLRRSVRQNTAGDGWESDGTPWTVHAGGYPGLIGAAQVRTTARESVAAGANMKTPAGLLIVDSAGTPIPMPATGEPARDPWTGQLTGGTQP